MGVSLCGLQESCKRFWSIMDLDLFFQNYHGLEKTIWLLHWELFGDLHCWCFLTCMVILSLIIPHFSLAHVYGVCGMNSRSVIKMMSEKRYDYYVFGSFLQSYHGLEAIWLLHWKLFGDIHCWCFLIGTTILSLVIPHFSFAHVYGVCGMSSRSVIEMMSERRYDYYVFGSILQSYHGLKAIWLLHWKLFGDLHC